MESGLKYILMNSYKSEMISHIKSHPEQFEEAIKLAILDDKKYSWRAAWLLWSCMEEDDPIIKRYEKKIVEIIPNRSGDIQREFLIILQKIKLNRKVEGKLFDVCVSIWENINNKPSVRYNAFKILAKITKNHRELINELKLLTENHYIDNLSDVVKKGIFKEIRRIEIDAN